MGGTVDGIGEEPLGEGETTDVQQNSIEASCKRILFVQWCLLQ